MKIFHKGGGGGGGGDDYESRFPPHSFVSLDISYSGWMRSKKQLSMCVLYCGEVSSAPPPFPTFINVGRGGGGDEK